jgi:thioredoxin 1
MKKLLLMALLATMALAQPKATRFEVAGMSCGDCAKNATKALRKIRGVTAVRVDYESKQATLTASRPVAPDEIRGALALVGMEARFPGETLVPALTDEERARLDIRAASEEGRAYDIKKQLAPGKITLFDFWAEWCGPCHLLTPKLEQLVKGDGGLALRTIDIDTWTSPASKQATREFHMSGLPYVRVYGPDGRFVGEVVGSNVEKVRALIAKARG